ncbi:hypothetical protein GF359_10055 [candidate division WOR-3 bacterium]|uniref:Uncharacterized protein n=1 Tax=candidate division WOR-3 bacterium TaxID=2052148 RepID=A0A9D5KB72_UNCW3|nr:hypothetical protein [candidate division WOR-3 bacterium]MBD3365544.1 hypothetical protein [candidate division WOR-3 bacterium]
MVKSDALEMKLAERYVPIFQEMMGMNQKQARKSFRQLYEKAKKDAEKEKTTDLPVNLGDLLLQREVNDKKVKKVLDKKRKEGVTDDDIKWWWNMSDIARRLMVKVDEVFIYTLYLKFTKEEGLSPEEANRKVRMNRPIFGNPDDARFARGKDRPLPDELRNRVNAFFIAEAAKDPEGFKKAAKACSSFNAFVRKQIKAGNL